MYRIAYVYIHTYMYIYIHKYISHALSLSARRRPAAAGSWRACNGADISYVYVCIHTYSYIHIYHISCIHTYTYTYISGLTLYVCISQISYIYRIYIAIYSYVYLSIPNSGWSEARSQW